MNELSAASPARQPTVPHAFSTSSGADGGWQDRQGGAPQFNLPDSYWLQAGHAGSLARPLAEPDFKELVARHLAASDESRIDLARIFKGMEEDRETDPRFQALSSILQMDTTPIQFADIELPAEMLAGLVVFKGPDGAPPQPQSRMTPAASAAAAVQQDTTASSCCIPPGCTIL